MLLVRVGVAAGVRELDADLLPVTLRVADTVSVALDVALGDIVGEAISLDDREGESEGDLLGVLLREAMTLGVREGVLELDSDALLVTDAEDVEESVGEAVELLEVVMLLVGEGD